MPRNPFYSELLGHEKLILASMYQFLYDVVLASMYHILYDVVLASMYHILYDVVLASMYHILYCVVLATIYHILSFFMMLFWLLCTYSSCAVLSPVAEITASSKVALFSLFVKMYVNAWVSHMKQISGI
jgi:hypothetical protein